MKTLILLTLLSLLSGCSISPAAFNPSKVEDYRVCSGNEYQNCYY